MLSDRIIPDELLLSRARFRFIRFVKCKRYLGYNKICKFVLGLFIKLCQLFLGRVKEFRRLSNAFEVCQHKRLQSTHKEI